MSTDGENFYEKFERNLPFPTGLKFFPKEV